MIRAALDARTAFPSLVIAEFVDGFAPRVLFAGSLQVGTNVERDSDDPSPLKLKRVVSDFQIREAVEMIVEKIVEFDPGPPLTIDPPSPSRPYMVRLVGELVKTLGYPVTVDTFPRTGSALGVRECFVNWPEKDSAVDQADGWRTGDYAGTRMAGRMLLGDIPIVQIPKDPDRRHSEKTPIADTVSRSREELQAAAGRSGVAIMQTAANWSGRPRILAIDTGSHIGVCVAERVGPGRFARVLSRTITLDPSEPDDRASFVEGLAEMIRAERVEKIVIERVDNVHGGDRGTGASAIASLRAMATRLVQAAWMGGMVECLALTRPGEAIDVETASAMHWRRKVCGGRGTPDDAAVGVKVREVFPDWPEQTTEHERDAAGLVVWAGLGELAAARPKGASKPRAKGPTKRREGCTCPPRHKGAHLGTCPLRKARSAGTVQKCKRCGQPRKGHVCRAKMTLGGSYM